ncbi:MAG: hypothetical protein HZB36_06255 [Candidatus Omnitrophica bacterium]|nr:hypothetical protein [Candidatus Omnitrophota bacterium]
MLQSGEGEAAVKTTIYLDDINRIETEEEYSYATKFIPTQLFGKDFKKLWEKGAPLPIPIEQEAEEELTKYPEEVVEEIEPLGPAPEVTTFSPGPTVGQSGKGAGSISGFIKLPEQFREYKGDLYVYIVQHVGNGRFALPDGSLIYQMIGKDSIDTELIGYKISGLGIGTYKVYAYWDTAPPPIKKKKVNGSDMFVGFGVKGDYVGGQLDEVTITMDGHDKIANIDNMTYISRDFPGAAAMYQETDLIISDIFYRKLGQKGKGLFLLAKNLGEESIKSLEFGFFINDEIAPSGPLIIGPLGPNEEKEFNISAAFEAYQKQMKESGFEVMGKMLRFKIVSKKTGEVELEKAIFIL